jgi:hypothetical protein
MPPERLMIQYVVLPKSRNLISASDARMMGTGNSPPPAVILDFMYGAAAYKHWHSGPAIDQVMKECHGDKVRDIPHIPTVPYLSDPSSEDAASDSQDEDYRPSGSTHRRAHYRSTMSEGMLHAMDQVLALSMWVKGNTVESLAAERQKRQELAEAHAQEAGRLKVQQWVNMT